MFVEMIGGVAGRGGDGGGGVVRCFMVGSYSVLHSWPVRAGVEAVAVGVLLAHSSSCCLSHVAACAHFCARQDLSLSVNWGFSALDFCVKKASADTLLMTSKIKTNIALLCYEQRGLVKECECNFDYVRVELGVEFHP